MRENIGLFKAKVAEYNSTLNLNEDDWVEGYIAKKKSKYTSPHAPVWFDEWFMCVPVRNEIYEYFEDVPIKFKTLCEFTGICDKNGKRVFENDVLKCAVEDPCTGKIYKYFNCIVKYCKTTNAWGWYGINEQGVLNKIPPEQNYLEIIGNKFEELEDERN